MNLFDNTRCYTCHVENPLTGGIVLRLQGEDGKLTLFSNVPPREYAVTQMRHVAKNSNVEGVLVLSGRKAMANPKELERCPILRLAK